MDNWHLLDDDTRKAIISKWSLAKRAENGYLDEYLSLKEICDLLYPVLPWPRRSEYSTRKAYSADKEAYNDAKNSNSLFLAQLISDCKNGLLAYEGDINAKIWQESFYIPDSAPSGRYICNAGICTTNKEQFKKYLQHIEKWPIDGVLANWYSDCDQQVENEISGDGEEIKGRLNNQVALIVKTAKELGYVDLLNIPIGGRAAIKTKCMTEYPGLFTKDSFKTSWREANERGLIRIENKEKFKSNQ